MQTYAYGHDFGNAETCGVVIVNRKYRQSRVIPSAIAQGSMEDLERLGVTIKPAHFVYKGIGNAGEQFVGELALEQSSLSFSGRGDIGRYWSEKSLIMLLVTASSLVKDDEFGLNVVTGLPVETYLGDPGSRKKIKTALEGIHVFSVNGKRRTIHVTVNRVIMEGAGAAIAYGMQDKSSIQGVIDIGGRTTDLFVAEGQTPLRHRCAGFPRGVEIAGDLLSTNFERKYGRPLGRLEIRRIFRKHVEHNDLPQIMARGIAVPNMPDLVEEALRQIGNEIVSFVSSQWGESEGGTEVASSFARVLSIGGGAHYFKKQLQALIPGAKFVECPEEANAYGYALFAEQQLQSLRAVS